MFDGPHCLSGSSHFGSRSASATQHPSSWQGSSNTPRSSAESFGGLPSAYACNTLPTTPTSSRSRDAFPDLSTDTSTDEATQPVTTSHSHWCFICPNPRVITTCDGWKRHMKEHETRYRCMPKGPIEYTAGGARCTFCGFRNPSQRHCDTHKAFPCANRTLDVRSYTRKPHFITHLKTHAIPNVDELAERWKDTIKKRHFACGFCISHFHSLIDQLNHIDMTHYRLFHNIRDWDPNKVIRGLLLQPGVSDSWQRILASHPGLMESLLHWDVSVIRKLQFRLEVGNESADILAESAFNESTRTYDPNHLGDIGTFDAGGVSHYGGVTTPQEAPVIQATAPRYFNLDERPVGNMDRMTSSASQMEPWALTNGLMSSHNNYLAPSDSNMAQENTAMRMRHAQPDTNQHSVARGNNYRTQPEPSPFTSWVSSQSIDSNSTAPMSLMMGNYWQGTTILSPMISSSMISSQLLY